MPKYKHFYSIDFAIESDNKLKDVTERELVSGLMKLLADIVSGVYRARDHCNHFETCGNEEEI